MCGNRYSSWSNTCVGRICSPWTGSRRGWPPNSCLVWPPRRLVWSPRRPAAGAAPGCGRRSARLAVPVGGGGEGPGDLRALEGRRAWGYLGHLRLTHGGQVLLDTPGEVEERLVVAGHGRCLRGCV